MDDRSAIRALQLAYGERFDARDPEGFAALFTEDAVMVQPGGNEIRTLEKFRKSVRNMPPRGDGYHAMLETEIRIEGDHASAHTRYRARSSITGQEMTGHYADEYRKTPEGWRFTRRAVFIDPAT